MGQPLVLTLRLDAASEKLLTTLRTRYFPQARNHLNAHITLFHALPSSSHSTTTAFLSQISTRETSFTVGIKTPFPLGRKGVGINIASFKLRQLHEELLNELKGEGVEMTEQDQRKLRPHVTVQNKVGEEEAMRTLEELRGSWEDTAGKAEALVMWRYEQGGSWTHLQDFPFSNSA
jgi:2'-5' RNA ligase